MIKINAKLEVANDKQDDLFFSEDLRLLIEVQDKGRKLESKRNVLARLKLILVKIHVDFIIHFLDDEMSIIMVYIVTLAMQSIEQVVISGVVYGFIVRAIIDSVQV